MLAKPPAMNTAPSQGNSITKNCYAQQNISQLSKKQMTEQKLVSLGSSISFLSQAGKISIRIIRPNGFFP